MSTTVHADLVSAFDEAPLGRACWTMFVVARDHQDVVGRGTGRHPQLRIEAFERRPDRIEARERAVSDSDYNLAHGNKLHKAKDRMSIDLDQTDGAELAALKRPQ